MRNTLVPPKRLSHDHAWRLVAGPQPDPRYGRPKVYCCDLCPATWTT